MCQGAADGSEALRAAFQSGFAPVLVPAGEHPECWRPARVNPPGGRLLRELVTVGPEVRGLECAAHLLRALDVVGATEASAVRAYLVPRSGEDVVFMPRPPGRTPAALLAALLLYQHAAAGKASQPRFEHPALGFHGRRPTPGLRVTRGKAGAYTVTLV